MSKPLKQASEAFHKPELHLEREQFTIERTSPKGSLAHLKNHTAEIQESAELALLEGLSLREVCERIGISNNSLARLRRKFPTFREALERAAYDGSTAILEQLRNTPWDEQDPGRARVKIDALSRYLELRWPERYGKRLDVTMKTLDIGDALSKARERAANTIESTAYVVHATERESVAALEDQSEGSVEDLIG